MQLHHHPIAPLALAAVLALAACGSDTRSAEPAPDATALASPDTAAGAPADTDPVVTDSSAEPSDGGTAADPSDAAANTPTAGSLCTTIPSLDVINSVLDEPVTTAEDLPRTPFEAICDVSGEGMSNVQFTWVEIDDRAALEALAADNEFGFQLSDLNDPALPGAVTYSAAVTVFVGDASYTVQAITFDTINDPNSPEAAQRSATLLAAWLQNLGVTL